MALESSIVPVPSEVVMPPAAFWAAQGKMDFWLVVLAGTLGSYFGSILNYWVAKVLGFPLLKKYGKYFFLPANKIELAHKWIQEYGTGGIFFARLFPVVRHLISIPAGVFRMPFVSFSVATLAGAGLWCLILSWFGQTVIGDHPELLHSPEEMVHVIKAKLSWFVVAAIVLCLLYGFVMYFKKRSRRA